MPHLRGHAWTIGPRLREMILPPTAPPALPWRREVEGPAGAGDEPTYVTGLYRHRPEADTLVVVIHGLGGCAESGYCVRAARAVDRAGHSCLRLSLRGANREGDDLYNAGLIQDLQAALEDPEFADHDHIWVIGFSMGGHLAMRGAVELDSPRFDRAAAICSPLDLGAAQRELDRPHQAVYRGYIMRELRALYRPVARRGRAPTPVERIEMAGTLREWDALTVVPRWGYRDVDDYYERASVAGTLDRLERPALFVGSRHDPMIRPESIEPALAEASDALEVVWSDRGGHVYFPPNLDLGLPGGTGVTEQVLGWMRRLEP